jgi:Carboxypeptidase regulatory-like domain
MFARAILILALAAPAAAQSAPQAPSASDRAQFSSVELRVTDRAGAPLESARINIDGITPYERETGSLGRVTFLKVRCGTYLARIERDGYVPLDKEFTVVPGRTTLVTASLSPARPRPVTVLGQLSAPSIPGFVETKYIER